MGLHTHTQRAAISPSSLAHIQTARAALGRLTGAALLAASASILTLTSPALGDDHTQDAAQAEQPSPRRGPPPRDPKTGWELQLGGAMLVAPHYRGDEDLRVLTVPFIGASYGEKLEIGFPQGLKYTVDDEGPLEYGVGLLVEPGREEDDAAILQGLGDVSWAIGPQAFASYRFGPVKFNANAFVDLADGHGGTRIDADVQFPVYLSRKNGVAFASLGTQWGDSGYVASLFGISPDQAANSAAMLPETETGAGITEYTFGLNYFRPLGQDWTWVTITSVSKLTGDAGDSPIVLDNTQVFTLTAITRTF